MDAVKARSMLVVVTTNGTKWYLMPFNKFMGSYSACATLITNAENNATQAPDIGINRDIDFSKMQRRIRSEGQGSRQPRRGPR